MPKSYLFKPPEHLVKQWPEVFDGLYMNTMPVAYINHINLIFNDGRIWEINVVDQLKTIEAETVATNLLEIFEEYQSEIVDVKFDIDIERLKIDIKSSTNNIL